MDCAIMRAVHRRSRSSRSSGEPASVPGSRTGDSSVASRSAARSAASTSRAMTTRSTWVDRATRATVTTRARSSAARALAPMRDRGGAARAIRPRPTWRPVVQSGVGVRRAQLDQHGWTWRHLVDSGSAGDTSCGLAATRSSCRARRVSSSVSALDFGPTSRSSRRGSVKRSTTSRAARCTVSRRRE